MEILAAINREDRCTVVVSLHQVEFARQYCPRIVALRQGKVVYDGPSAMLTNTLLADIYGAEVHELFAQPDTAARPPEPSVVVPFPLPHTAAA